METRQHAIELDRKFSVVLGTEPIVERILEVSGVLPLLNVVPTVERAFDASASPSVLVAHTHSRDRRGVVVLASLRHRGCTALGSPNVTSSSRVCREARLAGRRIAHAGPMSPIRELGSQAARVSDGSRVAQIRGTRGPENAHLAASHRSCRGSGRDWPLPCVHAESRHFLCRLAPYCQKPPRYAPGRIRTFDLALRRRALYPLSYGRGEGRV